jgi:dihydroorotate dehydrogenase (fumarate)
MESKGFEGINDFRGMLSHNKINNPAAYMRVQFLKTFAGKAEK